MSKPSNFSQFKWKLPTWMLDSSLELGIGLKNGRVGLEFQDYPVPVSEKPN